MEVPKHINLSFHFSSPLIKNILAAFIFLNIFFIFGTWLHNSLLLANKWHIGRILVSVLNLAEENNAATWYSSMLLLIVALAAFFCFLIDFQRLKKIQDQILNLGWLVLVMAFMTLSFDEMASFHERIGDTALFKNVGGSQEAGWYAFYALIAIVGLYMVVFSFLKFKGNKKALVFAAIGVLLFISNPFQEHYEIDSWKNSIDPDNWRRPIFFMLLEEGSEIFASFCFLKAFILYALNPDGKNKLGLENKSFNIKLNFKRFYIYVLAFIICSGLLMVIIRINAWQMQGDKGISYNWFPSFMGLFVALIGSYLYFLFRSKEWSPKTILLLFILFGLFISLFYGSNLYATPNTFLAKISVLFIGATVICGGLAFMKFKGLITKLSIAVGVLCIIVSIYFTKYFKTALFGYFAASFFLLTLIFYYLHVTQESKRNFFKIKEQAYQVARIFLISKM